MFYGVYYYVIDYHDADVHLLGFYKTLNEAKARLALYMPNYKPHCNNTVIGNQKIGWINKYQFGDFDSDLTCNQPHSSVNLFDS